MAIALALVMGLAAIAAAAPATAPRSGPASASAPSPASAAPATPLVASGPMTSLGLRAEVGTSLGGVANPSILPSLSQSDLVVVQLPFRNAPELSSFLQSISNPNSPEYDQFLTNAQFTQAYGPALADQQGIANYLASQGLKIVYLSPDHTSVAARGTLAQIQQAFSVHFLNYEKRGQTFFAPAASPSVPASLRPYVQSVVGLTSYDFGYSPQITLGGGTAIHSDGGVPGSGVEDYPNQMTEEFQLNQLWNATGNASAGVVPSFAKGVTIATALWDLNNSAPPAPQYCPYSMTDIDQFFNGSAYSAPGGMPHQLPSPIDHANYMIPGDAGNPPGTGNCTSPVGGANIATEELDFEMTIDQEWSGEDAPGAFIEPTYVGGEGVTVEDADLTILLDWIAAGNIPHLDAVSQSFGGGEGGTTWESQYQEMAAKGVTVLASSGDDNGAGGFEEEAPATCQDSTTPYSWDTEGVPIVDYPGSSPNVLSVGGTANLQYASSPDNSASILSGQTVWNWCPSTDSGQSAGSTGGVSADFTAPSWQTNNPIVNKAMLWAIQVTETGNFSTGAPPSGCFGCDDGTVASTTSARAVPDIGGPAANNTGYMAGGWVSGFGGTSFSSPSVAGVLGSVMAFDGHPLGFVNPTLYALEQGYLNGSFSGLPFPVAPTYFVKNYSNAFFAGGLYNTSAGWGVPQAYNLALLLGKPFLSTNPQGPSRVGSAYPVSALVKDDKPLFSVKVSYLEPGASTWANVSLTRSAGTANVGTWSGTIPAPTQTGILEYCVSGTDTGLGNSWSPYNQSAWAATGSSTNNFGCTTPFHVGVRPGAQTVTFTEKGLTAGTSWSVTLDSTTLSSTGTTIQFTAANGAHSYAVGAVTGYSVKPASGTVTVNGAPVNVAIKFTKLSGHLYPLTFVETGLGSPTHEWNVTITNVGRLATTGTTIAFSLPNGTYTYRIAVGHPQDSYKTTFSGKATIAGAPVTVNVKFTQAQYKVTWQETGLASGTSWTVTANGSKHGTSTGTTISFTLANGTFNWVATASGYTTQTGTVTVNGASPPTVMVTFTRSGSPAGGPSEGGVGATPSGNVFVGASRPAGAT